MPFYEKGGVRIHYEEAGSGFPLFIVYGGGLDSVVEFANKPFDAVAQFKSEYRCILMDLRNAEGGQSSGPLEADRPWDAYAEDQLGLLDHLGVKKFHIMGFCIGNPMIWNLVTRASERIQSIVSAQPSGCDPDNPTYTYQENLRKWAPGAAKRTGTSPELVEKYLKNLYQGRDFVYTASREFVRNCQLPLLVLPDQTKAHPYVTAMEMAHTAPNAQVSLYPWKDKPENIRLALRHIETFLKAHTPSAPRA